MRPDGRKLAGDGLHQEAADDTPMMDGRCTTTTERLGRGMSRGPGDPKDGGIHRIHLRNSLEGRGSAGGARGGYDVPVFE